MYNNTIQGNHMSSKVIEERLGTLREGVVKTSDFYRK